MTERTQTQISEDITTVAATMREQEAYVRMLRDTYRRARAELTAQRRQYAELVDELSKHLEAKQ